MTRPPAARRSSPGGHAVSDSLALAGFAPNPAVALVETVRPTRRAHDRVLCQNAWNFLPRREYSDLIQDYSPGRRARYAARRAVAGINTRRASVNVVLSDYMAGLLASRGRRTLLAPVTLPWDLCTAEQVATARADALPPSAGSVGGAVHGSPAVDRPFVLVPGTLTWYKDPGFALDLVARVPAADRPLLVFAGTDDGSGCASHVQRRAADEGIATWIGPADRDLMKWFLTRAELTLVPSRLESLSFSMSEALLLAPRVAATPLPVHREVAGRMGREPVWLPDDPTACELTELMGGTGAHEPTDVAPFLEQWLHLARVLDASTGSDS